MQWNATPSTRQKPTKNSGSPLSIIYRVYDIVVLYNIIYVCNMKPRIS